jgi:hypothetical protein
MNKGDEMNKLRLLTLIILVLGAVIGTAAYAKRKQDDFTYSHRPHHVIYAMWRVDGNGNKTLGGFRVRDVDGSGAYTEWSVNKELGKTYTRPTETQPVSADRLNKPVSWYRSRPNLLREEWMLGYQCFTLNMGEGNEATFSPELGVTPLRFTAPGVVGEALKVY